MTILDTRDSVDHITFSDKEISFALVDGRVLTVPLDWYPRLAGATPEQRQAYRLAGNGRYIHWPEIDEDLEISGVLRGNRAPEGSADWTPPPHGAFKLD